MKDKYILNKFRKCFGQTLKIYDSSLVSHCGNRFFLAKEGHQKFLYIIGNEAYGRLEEFRGKPIGSIEIDGYDLIAGKAELNHINLKLMQEIFPHLNPSLCGLKPSFGTGDRLGMVTPAHVGSFRGRKIFPYFCQQSVRELNKTGRSWQESISDSIWGVFEAGYKNPFGADADHVKDMGDLNAAIKNGFTMFTIDPSDFIANGLGNEENREISKRYDSIVEKKEIERSYLGKKITIGKEVLQFDLDSLKFIAACYYDAIKHVVKCYKFIEENKEGNFDFEVSMDETESAISPLAHIFITGELQRNEVNFQNLALRYPGVWEKAVDYCGDIEGFSKELKTHAQVAKKFGPYKLSLHSGSEKFSVFPIFSEETGGLFHIKTSGTSWLESLRTIAAVNPVLFKDIYDYALNNYEEEKKSYHISTGLSSVPAITRFSRDEYGGLLDKKECRQMLHVTYGAILTATKQENYIFRDTIYKVLDENEPVHYRHITENIDKHLDLVRI